MEKAKPAITRPSFAIRFWLLEKLLFIFYIIHMYIKVPPDIPFVTPFII